MSFLSSSLAPTATVLPYAAVSAPSGWLICDGSEVSRTTYANLFAVIGTSYGSGNGSTTFNVPDYRWAFLRGYGPDIDSTSGAGTASNNNIVINNHGFNRSGIKIKIPAAIVLPAGLALSEYWVIVVDSNTIAFATSKNNATELTPVKVSISGSYSNVRVSQIEDPDMASRKRNARGGNLERNIGSWQEDTIRNITGAVATSESTYSTGAFAHAGSVSGNSSTGGSTDYYSTFDSSRVVPVGNDNRPSNISVNYIIKV